MPLIEQEFYHGLMASPDPDRLRYGHIAAAAPKLAPGPRRDRALAAAENNARLTRRRCPHKLADDLAQR